MQANAEGNHIRHPIVDFGKIGCLVEKLEYRLTVQIN